MKKFIKILAVLLCISTVLVNSIPSVSALGETEETTATYEEETTQQPSEIPEETPDEGEEIPDEDGENEEITYPETPEEEENLGYGEAVLGCVVTGGHNIGAGFLLLGATLISPLLFFAFPPIGVAAGLAGLPMGIASILVGLLEVIGSPLIALFVSDASDLIFL